MKTLPVVLLLLSILLTTGGIYAFRLVIHNLYDECDDDGGCIIGYMILNLLIFLIYGCHLGAFSIVISTKYKLDDFCQNMHTRYFIIMLVLFVISFISSGIAFFFATNQFIREAFYVFGLIDLNIFVGTLIMRYRKCKCINCKNNYNEQHDVSTNEQV